MKTGCSIRLDTCEFEFFFLHM